MDPSKIKTDASFDFKLKPGLAVRLSFDWPHRVRHKLSWLWAHWQHQGKQRRTQMPVCGFGWRLLGVRVSFRYIFLAPKQVGVPAAISRPQ